MQFCIDDDCRLFGELCASFPLSNKPAFSQVGLFVVAANIRATRKLKADNEGYSVSRTFQIRENIAIIEVSARYKEN